MQPHKDKVAHTLPEAGMPSAQRGLGGAALPVISDLSPIPLASNTLFNRVSCSVLFTMPGLDKSEDSVLDAKFVQENEEEQEECQQEQEANEEAGQRLCTLTPAQELLQDQGTAEFVRIGTQKVRSFMRNTLLSNKKFKDKMRLYLLKTHGTSTFYDNRLAFDSGGGTWMFVEASRQCSCCGQMLASHGKNGKLLSCGTCKTTHYCDRACQKRHWKHGHKSVCRPAEDKQGIELVLHMCVRALSYIRLTTTVQNGPETLELISPEVLSSIFLQKKDARWQKYVDLANDQNPKGQDRVCNHFRKKQESNRILFPIWEAATDSLAFVPISLDFLLNGLGVSDALVTSFEKEMSTNDDRYFVVVMGMVKGKIAVVGGSSFIGIPDMAHKLCEEGERAK